jgi:putative hydroxymethylpyrimidine transport system substrate-binding protein
MPVSAVLALLALALAAAGCGEKSENANETPSRHAVDLVLDWFPNPDHVAIYEARARGYFDQVGLDVKPHVPSDPAAPIKQVAAGRADLAISYEPEVLLARQQGLPVVAVAALVQRPLTSLIATRKSGVRSVRDLRGKRVGTAGIPYQSAYLKTILRRAHIPASAVKETNVGASLMPAMLSGKVDATLGGFWNVEGVELRSRGAKPWIESVDKLGVPDYDELVLVANADKLDGERDDLRLFISAVARGASEARRDPGGASRALLDANRDLKRKETTESVRLTIPTLFPKSGRPWGYLDPIAWQNYGGWMASNGVLKKLPNVDAAVTNKLLPGQGL